MQEKLNDNLKKIDEASDYLLSTNSMSGELVYHLLRCIQHNYLNDGSTLADLIKILDDYCPINLDQCKEFDDVIFKYNIDINDFIVVWNMYFIKYLNQLDVYNIARLIDIKLCDHINGFPIKIHLKEEYNLMDKTTKLIDLYKKEVILAKN